MTKIEFSPIGLLSWTLALLLVAGPGLARAEDLSKLDLTGDWYVLVHYKDSRSEDKSITKFKDFAWSIEAGENKLTIQSYPYVVFDKGSEELRRFAMRSHQVWQPEGGVLDALRTNLDVASRAMKSKRLKGNHEKGFASPPPMGSGGAMTMSFTQIWKIAFLPEKVRILVTDSLSGGSEMLGEMEEAIIYEITDKTPEGDLIGRYSEDTKQGSLRLIRSKERRVVK